MIGHKCLVCLEMDVAQHCHEATTAPSQPRERLTCFIGARSCRSSPLNSVACPCTTYADTISSATNGRYAAVPWLCPFSRPPLNILQSGRVGSACCKATPSCWRLHPSSKGSLCWSIAKDEVVTWPMRQLWSICRGGIVMEVLVLLEGQ